MHTDTLATSTTQLAITRRSRSNTDATSDSTRSSASETRCARTSMHGTPSLAPLQIRAGELDGDPPQLAQTVHALPPAMQALRGLSEPLEQSGDHAPSHCIACSGPRRAAPPDMRWPWLAILVGCSTVVADSKPPAKRFEHDMMVRFHMHQNFDLLRSIERLLLKGKLDDAKQFASAIASSPDEPAHGAWATQKTAIRDRAAALARSTSVAEALRKTAAVGAACATCHNEHGIAFADQMPRLPSDTGTLDARMARHRWAADRLWEAVVGNSEPAWQAGLDVLAATPLDQPADRIAIARKLQGQAIGARAKTVDRSAQYGEMLVTCSSCHMPKR